MHVPVPTVHDNITMSFIALIKLTISLSKSSLGRKCVPNEAVCDSWQANTLNRQFPIYTHDSTRESRDATYFVHNTAGSGTDLRIRLRRVGRMFWKFWSDSLVKRLRLKPNFCLGELP